MGRGDKRTERGKRARGSFGKARSKAQLKARARTVAKPKAETPPAPAPAETPATEQPQAEESA